MLNLETFARLADRDSLGVSQGGRNGGSQDR